MPSTAQAGVLRRGDQAVDHVAADGDDHDARARAGGGVDRAERLEVEHRLVDRHRDVVRRADAHGLLERLVVGEHRQVERAHDDALVRDAEAHARAEVVLGEERAQLVGERGRVRDLAVTQDAGRSCGHGALLDRELAVDVDLGGGEVARIELETDDGLVLAAA